MLVEMSRLTLRERAEWAGEETEKGVRREAAAGVR